MSSQLKTAASTYALYWAAGELDGTYAELSVSSITSRIHLAFGPLGLNLSADAARELAKHLALSLEAIEADQQAFGPLHTNLSAEAARELDARMALNQETIEADNQAEQGGEA